MAEINLIGGVSYWAWLGTLALIFLTFQDFKNGMLVDDRRNYFMMGATVALLSHNHHNLWYVINAIGLGIGINILINKLNLLGGSDANTLTWLWIGYAFIDYRNLIIFFTVFVGFYAFYMLVKIIIMRINKVKKWNTPFYIVILASFIITNIIMKLY